jgi:hypothetical protein
LKGLLLKKLNHGFPKGIILINFYVILAKCHKDILDNSSEGSFPHRMVDEAWELLEKISETDNRQHIYIQNYE